MFKIIFFFNPNNSRLARWAARICIVGRWKNEHRNWE